MQLGLEEMQFLFYYQNKIDLVNLKQSLIFKTNTNEI